MQAKPVSQILGKKVRSAMAANVYSDLKPNMVAKRNCRCCKETMLSFLSGHGFATANLLAMAFNRVFQALQFDPPRKLEYWPRPSAGLSVMV